MKRKERGDKEKQTSTSSSQKTFFLKKVRCKKDDTFVKMSGYLLYAANKDAGEEAVEPPPDADSGVSGVRSSAPIAALYSLQLETISVSILAKLRLLLFGLFTVLLDPPMWNLDLSPHCVISAASPR